MSISSRQYDLILLGATGFTGKLTAEYIAKFLPTDLTWAVAGRDAGKLSAVIDNLMECDPKRKQPAIEVTELSKEKLDILARKTRVLITTVGPYHRHGTPVIEACARAGTHYLDSTGETPWVYDVAHKYHDLARSNGAVLIPHCATESAPADLIAFVLGSFVRGKYGKGTGDMVHSVQKFNNGLSGGTLHSLITVASSYSFSHLRKSLNPYALCAGQTPTTPPFVPRFFSLVGSHAVPGLGILTDSVIGIPDTTLVYRSWSLMNGGENYGSNFRYWTGMKAKNRVTGFLWHWMMVLSLPMLLLSPLRWLLTKLIPSQGQGPTKESQAKSSTSWKSIARIEPESSLGAVCNMSFDKDMYTLTAILLAEAAMVLLRPDRENWAQKLGGGVLTPATLGHQFVERVTEAGVKLNVTVLNEEGKSSV